MLYNLNVYSHINKWIMVLIKDDYFILFSD
jgi:hypothetical protein